MSLASYLDRAVPDVRVAEIDPAQADSRDDLDRLLDPAPLPAESGWCTLPDGVGYVACRTPMPGVSAAMVDWWFDWHPREALRYRVWHPLAHKDNRLEPGPPGLAKRHWGTVHHPVEDIGDGDIHARIEFLAPSQLGFSGDHLDLAGTIACGYAGDDRRRTRHTLMVHAFLADGDGLVLRSRFWLGAVLRPYLPGALGDGLASGLNRPAVRRALVPRDAPRHLAAHCAEEFAHLATILPELHHAFA